MGKYNVFISIFILTLLFGCNCSKITKSDGINILYIKTMGNKLLLPTDISTLTATTNSTSTKTVNEYQLYPPLAWKIVGRYERLLQVPGQPKIFGEKYINTYIYDISQIIQLLVKLEDYYYGKGWQFAGGYPNEYVY